MHSTIAAHIRQNPTLRKRIAARIQALLEEQIPHPAIPLAHRDPYTLLIAVLLSAQCLDSRVNRITPLLFARAASPEAMVELTIAEIASIIRPCGLARRKGSAIWHLSRILLDQHGGSVPCSWKALEELPGVGHKTASVVMVQAFGEAAFPVDTHIHRCAARWGLSDGRSVIHTENDLKELFPQENWGKIHLQIIYFARTFCPAKKHDESLCPICRSLTTWIF